MPRNLLWTCLFYAWITSEVVLAIVTRTGRTQGRLHDRGSLYILWIVIVATLSSIDWIRLWLPAADFSASSWLKPLTVFLLIAGLAIRWTAILSLGRAFSVNVAIRPTQQIYRSGLYRFVRHPSYLGMVLIFAAIGLRSRNYASLAVVLVATTAALLYRIRIEEQALSDAFGADYLDYSRRTRRLIPGIY